MSRRFWAVRSSNADKPHRSVSRPGPDDRPHDPARQLFFRFRESGASESVAVRILGARVQFQRKSSSTYPVRNFSKITALVPGPCRPVRELSKGVTGGAAKFGRILPWRLWRSLLPTGSCFVCRHMHAHAGSDGFLAEKPALHFAQLLRRDPRISAVLLVLPLRCEAIR